jgi:hypothetical protein
VRSDDGACPLTDVDAAPLVAIRPLPERAPWRLFGQSPQRISRVSPCGELPGDEVATGAGLPHRCERAAVLDRVGATAEAEADRVAPTASLRLPHRDRCARPRLLSAQRAARHGD